MKDNEFLAEKCREKGFTRSILVTSRKKLLTNDNADDNYNVHCI